jgi:hypothetical protein
LRGVAVEICLITDAGYELPDLRAQMLDGGYNMNVKISAHPTSMELWRAWFERY